MPKQLNVEDRRAYLVSNGFVPGQAAIWKGAPSGNERIPVTYLGATHRMIARIRIEIACHGEPAGRVKRVCPTSLLLRSP